MKKILLFLTFGFLLLLGTQAVGQTLTDPNSGVDFKEAQELRQALKIYYFDILPDGTGNINPDVINDAGLRSNTILVLEAALSTTITSMDEFVDNPYGGLDSAGSTTPSLAYQAASTYYVAEANRSLGVIIDPLTNSFLEELLTKISK